MVTRNWRTCVFYTNSRTRWHEGVLYIMQRPPFKCICTHTHTHIEEVANENLNCTAQFCTLHLSYSFRLVFLLPCSVSNIFPIIFSITFFFVFCSLIFLFFFFLLSYFFFYSLNFLPLFPGHVLSSHRVYLWYFCAKSKPGKLSLVFLIVNTSTVECKVIRINFALLNQTIYSRVQEIISRMLR